MTNDAKTWTVTVEHDPETGDAILPFPPDLLAEVGWNPGDDLRWVDRGDGTWEIQKVER